MESFNQLKLSEQNISFDVKQINFARSQRQVLRGLHYQREPFAQAKLVGVISGAVLDAVVDIRKDSPTYLKHIKVEISSPDVLLLIPRGFAHGYLTLKDETIFYYAVDNFYNSAYEDGINYNDPKLNIQWELTEDPIISPKDLQQPYL